VRWRQSGRRLRWRGIEGNGGRPIASVGRVGTGGRAPPKGG
jgi:hypothetical protein